MRFKVGEIMRPGDLIIYRMAGSRQMGLVLACQDIDCGPMSGSTWGRTPIASALVQWFENGHGPYPTTYNANGTPQNRRERRKISWVPIQSREGINLIDVVK